MEFLDPENYELWSQGKDYTPALTGDDIKGADAKIDSTETGDDNVVQLSFTTAGAQKFADVTTAFPSVIACCTVGALTTSPSYTI